MRVIYLDSFWANQHTVKPSRLAFAWFSTGAAAMGLVVLILTAFSLQSTAKNPIVKFQTTHNVKAATTINSEQLLNQSPPNSLSAALLQKLAAPKPLDCATQPCVALTFDDGPDPTNTPKIMDALDKEGVKATFFLVGNHVQDNAAIVQRMYHEGFEIGNHSWSHPNLTKLTPQQIQDQITQTQNVIAGLGIPPPTLFRPPYGAINKAVMDQIHMPIIRWDVDPKDWEKADPASVIATVEAQAHPGAVIVLHSTKAATADAAPAFIQNLKSRFRLVTVTQLLSLKPGVQGDFRSR